MITKQVSFDDENLILVDEQDTILGYRSKLECHQGDGILHRAFSIFIFNGTNELLLQQRSKNKLLWPLFWSNSCCSHPRQGETYQQAIHRRLEEELGIKTDLKYLYQFTYQARFGEIGSENELCSVYIGKSSEKIRVNINEIAEWRFISPEELDREMQTAANTFTPWFKLEWQRLRTDFMPQIRSLP